MKKKAIMISAIAGMLVLGLCVKFAAGSRDAAAVDSTAVAEGVVSAEGIWPEELPTEQKLEVQNTEKRDCIAIPEMISLEKPVVKLNGEEGELRYDWDYNSVRVDEETLLLTSECYFLKEDRQQKIFFLAKAPYYIPHEVFRQDDKSRGVSDPQEWEEYRMKRLHSIDGGYVYEVDGALYFMDRNFQETSLLCDLCQLMGDLYSFSPETVKTCDLTEDALRMLACTDEGLYEYQLESGERKLLEPAFFARHEIAIAEGDCACGARDFEFSGPVMAAYAPDGQNYAFLTGTEEADWGEITGAVLRTGEGRTLYQRETEHIYDFKWIETGDTIYLAVFYQEDKSEKIDRVDVNSGEMVTFEVPEEIFLAFLGGFDCHVHFLDADNLFYWNYDKQDAGQNIFEIYNLYSEERHDFEIAGDVDWEISVFDCGDHDTHPVRYPKDLANAPDGSSGVYEDFLNGEITVELEEQHVYIDELFWDNDIEYCFLDIDGDGSGELQIRDSRIYYVVKVQEGALRVIWEGWWNYEPVLADGRCGILHYADGYGSEWIEFSTMSADGSMEKEDSICWSDENKNGKLDEGDFFYDSGDIDREQYLTKREEYAAMRSENELEWTGRRLKDFATWQDAYIDFILKIHVTEWEPDVGFLYSLLYVDADDVPELCIDTRVAVSGELIVSFYDGKVRCVNRERGGMRYIERGGLLYNDYGAMGFYPCNIYLLEKGEFLEIGTGWYSDYADEQGNIYYDYFWEEKPVTEAAFEACIDALIDRTKCVEPSLWYSEAKILEILVE